jgi:hypothetical protein
MPVLIQSKVFPDAAEFVLSGAASPPRGHAREHATGCARLRNRERLSTLSVKTPPENCDW